MRVAILAVNGMFDSGLTLVMDILGTANTLSSRVSMPGPRSRRRRGSTLSALRKDQAAHR